MAEEEWVVKPYINNNGAFFNYKNEHVFDVWPDGAWGGDVGGKNLENDLESVAEILQSLRAVARKYFGADWGRQGE